MTTYYDPNNYRPATVEEIAQEVGLSEAEVQQIIDQNKKRCIIDPPPEGVAATVMLRYSFGVRR